MSESSKVVIQHRITFAFSEDGCGEAVREKGSYWQVSTPFGDERYWGTVSELRAMLKRKAKEVSQSIVFQRPHWLA